MIHETCPAKPHGHWELQNLPAAPNTEVCDGCGAQRTPEPAPAPEPAPKPAPKRK